MEEKKNSRDKYRRPTFSSLPTERGNMKEVMKNVATRFERRLERNHMTWKSALGAVTVLGLVGAVGAFAFKKTESKPREKIPPETGKRKSATGAKLQGVSIRRKETETF